MINYILYPIVELKGYIILLVVLLFLATGLALFLMGKKRQNIAAFGWQALFLGRTKRELLWMCLGLSQMIFVIAMIFFFTTVGKVQLTAWTLLCVVKGIVGLSVSGLIGELFYGGMTVAALMTGNLLIDYMEDTGLDVYIFLVWALLSLFVIQYGLYSFVRGLERMLRQHEWTEQRQKQKENNE